MGQISVYRVRYRIYLPNPNTTVNGEPGNSYTRDPVETIVSANDQSSVAGVLASNLTLQAGELLEVLEINQFEFGGGLSYT